MAADWTDPSSTPGHVGGVLSPAHPTGGADPARWSHAESSPPPPFHLGVVETAEAKSSWSSTLDGLLRRVQVWPLVSQLRQQTQVIFREGVETWFGQLHR